MNPLLKEFLSAALRWVLTGAGGWFVQQGILNPDQVDKMIAGAILAILALGWSLYSKYTSKVESNTLAAMPKGTTLVEAQKSIARGISAPAGTGAGDVPVLINNKGDSVKPPRGNMGAWLLPLLLAGSLASAFACAGGVQ